MHLNKCFVLAWTENNQLLKCIRHNTTPEIENKKPRLRNGQVRKIDPSSQAPVATYSEICWEYIHNKAWGLFVSAPGNPDRLNCCILCILFEAWNVPKVRSERLAPLMGPRHNTGGWVAHRAGIGAGMSTTWGVDTRQGAINYCTVGGTSWPTCYSHRYGGRSVGANAS